ncbi:MAG TPA: hypothetical protein VMV62_01880 [Candidatus Paceibacterota bacterium]|nr:hypothetical protein [Candidatus Paceibacterota bacterium]
MPPSRNNDTPPQVMTWPKAMPVLAIAGIFDLLRMFFDMFWFFGPFLAAVAANEAVGGGVTGAVVGGGVGLFAGTLGAPAIEAFGVVMAMAIGLAGWMAIGLTLALQNRRIFAANSDNTIWFIAGLMVSEIPLVGALPALFGSMYRMYRAQIKKDQAALAAYEAARAAKQLRQGRQQEAALMQRQEQVQLAQAQQEAANDASYAEQEAAANDEAYAQESDDMPTDAAPFPQARVQRQLVGVPQYTKKTA